MAIATGDQPIKLGEPENSNLDPHAGVFFLILETQNDYVRFHAWQVRVLIDRNVQSRGTGELLYNQDFDRLEIH